MIVVSRPAYTVVACENSLRFLMDANDSHCSLSLSLKHTLALALCVLCRSNQSETNASTAVYN